MEDYMGTIRPWGPVMIPKNFAPCDGRILNITQYQALYSLIGNQFGGDGAKTFALPDLRGRFPLCYNNTGAPVGTKSGEERVTLTTDAIPPHGHNFNITVKPKCATSGGTATGTPLNNVRANYTPSGTNVYSDTATQNAYMAALDVSFNQGGGGSNMSHQNMPPFQAVNYIICIYGLYPTHR